jgi:hypothetical protein
VRQVFTVLVAAAALAGSAACARAGGPVALYVGGEVRKMTRAVCARKAVEAMGVREKFPFAEVTADGNARGWNDTNSVLVLSFPTPDAESILILVVAAGKADAETARLRDAVRAHVFDGPHDPNAPKRVAPEGGPPAGAVRLGWKSEERGAINQLRFFEPVAALAFEKRGLGTNVGGKNLVFGAFAGGTTAAFLATTANAVSVRLNVVVATDDEDAGGKLAANLLAAITKMIYE